MSEISLGENYSWFHWHAESFFFPHTHQTLWKKLEQLQVLPRCVSKVQSLIHCHGKLLFYLSIIRHSKNLLTYQWCNHIFWKFFVALFLNMCIIFSVHTGQFSETFRHNRVDIQTTKPRICMFMICTTSKKTILDT